MNNMTCQSRTNRLLHHRLFPSSTPLSSILGALIVAFAVLPFAQSARASEEPPDAAAIMSNPNIGLYKAYAEFKMARYASARGIWEVLADNGIAEAWFNLGILAEDGLGEPVDHALALKRYRQGAEGGSAKAQYRLALLHLDGRLLTPDRQRAQHWLRMAAESGYEDAVQLLRQLTGESPEDHYLSARLLESEGHAEQAAAIYRRLSEAGNLRARTRLAWLYEAGRGVERDLDSAMALFRSAAEAGDAEAQFALSVLLATGVTGEHDPDAARQWLNRSAAAGYPEAIAARAGACDPDTTATSCP